MRGFLLCLPALLALPCTAQTPESLRPDVTVRRVATVAEVTTRIAHDPSTGALYTLSGGGEVFRFPPPFTTGTLVASTSDHGLGWPVLGLAIDTSGVLYIGGNVIDGDLKTGIVKRGTSNGSGGFVWSTVARTEAFPRSGTGYDHDLNGIVVSPNGTYLFVNHGSRTEHGEEQSTGGSYPGLREIPITSLIFRIPVGSVDLVLPNGEAALLAGGYLFADGVRNAFDLAFDGTNELYATENSGDRDDGDELNRIREGHHYGFPWRMGLHDTPQQFPGYDPDEDPLVNPKSGAYQAGLFYDDPTYPPPPVGVTFTDPVYNVGPDADIYREEGTGAIVDGSATGTPVATFTPHRSPLGLAFDVASELPAPFTGDGFVLSWTNGDPASPSASPLLTPFGDHGQDLLHLDFLSPDTVAATRIVRGFSGPMDAVLLGRTLYVVEMGGTLGLWAVEFTGTTATELPAPEVMDIHLSPNPFRTAARVTFDVPQTATYRIEVSDVLGRRVALLHEGALGSGTHTFTLNGRGLPAGLYHIRVASPEGVVSRPVVKAD